MTDLDLKITSSLKKEWMKMTQAS